MLQLQRPGRLTFTREADGPVAWLCHGPPKKTGNVLSWPDGTTLEVTAGTLGALDTSAPPGKVAVGGGALDLTAQDPHPISYPRIRVQPADGKVSVEIRTPAEVQSRSAPGGLELLSPRGGESWSADSIHRIRWAAAPGPDERTVRLECSIDGGAAWQAITGAAAGAGTFLWQIPDAISSRCMVRARLNGAPAETVVSSEEFAMIPSQKVEGYRWENVTMSAAYAPRDGAGALVYKGKMWMIGGWRPSYWLRHCNNEVWNTEDGREWTLVKPNSFIDDTFHSKEDWEGRHCAGYVVHRDKMWIVGGDVNQGHYQNDVWSSSDGVSWTAATHDAPWGPRNLHYTVAFKDNIWVMGGQTIPGTAPSEERFYNDVWCSEDGVNWTEVSGRDPLWSANPEDPRIAGPPHGMICGSVVFNDRMWILGGGIYDTPGYPDWRKRLNYNDVWSTADGVSWERHTAAAPWYPRQYHSVAVFDGRMWVMEGWHQDSGNRNDVWYSADGVNWYEVPDTPWAVRHASTAYAYKGALWMVAGNNMDKAVWKMPAAAGDRD